MTLLQLQHIRCLLMAILLSSFTIGLGAQTASQQQKISTSKSKIPLIDNFLATLQFGDVHIKEDATNFVFTQETANITLEKFLTELGGILNIEQVLLNNPLVKELDKEFTNNKITAIFTTKDASTNPSYLFSIVAEALHLKVEVYTKKTSTQSDYVLAFAPNNIPFKKIDPALKVLDELGEANVGLFMARTSTGTDPEMKILKDMGLQGKVSFDNGFTALASINVPEMSEMYAIFGIRNYIAKATIPDKFTDPVSLSASLKPGNWKLGNDAEVSDVTLTLSAGIDGATVKAETTASFTLSTKMPSSPYNVTPISKSNIDWTVTASLSGKPTETGLEGRLGGEGIMKGKWSTPFGINELNLDGGSLGFGLNFKIIPAYPSGVTVTVTPDMSMSGVVEMGRTKAIKLAMAGVIDFSEPFSSGIYGKIDNIGLGTVIDQLYLNKLGNGVDQKLLTTLDTVFLNHGKLNIFPTGATIGGKEYPMGLGLAGSGRAFGLGAGINFFLGSDGVYGELDIDTIVWKVGPEEIFSIRGYEANKPLKASINLQHKNLKTQLTDAFNNIPFLVVDAQVKLLGSSSKTKLLLNPFKGSYFASNTKILDVVDIALDAEMESLSQFAKMNIRGAFDAAPLEDVNKAVISHLKQAVKGAADYLLAKGNYDADIAKIQNEVDRMRNIVKQERADNILAFEKAKADLQTKENEYNKLAQKASEKWAVGDVIATNELNRQKDLISIDITFSRAYYNTMIWVTNLPQIELDPRISSLEREINRMVSERNMLKTFGNLSPQVSGIIGNIVEFIDKTGVAKLVDIKSIKFAGGLDILSSGNYDVDINMNLMENPINIKSKLIINRKGEFNYATIISDILHGKYTPEFSTDNSVAIGKKYNYSANYNTIHPVVQPDHSKAQFSNSSLYSQLNMNAGDISNLDNNSEYFGGQNFKDAQGSWGHGWDEITVEAWIKNDGNNGDFQTILSGDEGFVHFQLHSKNDANNVIYLDNGQVILLPILPDVQTTWRHVAIVAKSGRSMVYQNGALAGPINLFGFGGGKIAPTSNIRIGGNKVYGRAFKGSMTNVRVWNKARTQDEIKAGMHGHVDANSPGLVKSFFETKSNDHVERSGVLCKEDNIAIVQSGFTNGLHEFTLEAWVNNQSLAKGINGIVSAPDGAFAHLQMSNTGANNAVYFNDGGYMLLPGIPVLTEGWHHVALSVQSGNSNVYVDGQQIGASNPQQFGMIKPSATLLIGNGFEHDRPFEGKIANVRIWNKAKSREEIIANSLKSNLNNQLDLIYHSPTTNPTLISKIQDAKAVPSSATTGVSNITIEAWVNNSTLNAGEIQAIISSTGPDFLHFQMANSTSVNNAVYLNDGRSIMLPCIPKLNPGWHHVAIILESGNSRVVIDGEIYGESDNTVFSGLKDSQTVFIGKGWGNGRMFNGQIADVRIWKNRVLTPEQIKQYYQTPPPANATALAFHLK